MSGGAGLGPCLYLPSGQNLTNSRAEPSPSGHRFSAPAGASVQSQLLRLECAKGVVSELVFPETASSPVLRSQIPSNRDQKVLTKSALEGAGGARLLVGASVSHRLLWCAKVRRSGSFWSTTPKVPVLTALLRCLKG